jgi:nitrite reductase (cytochrome c-552)
MAEDPKQPLFERRSTYVVLTVLVAIAAAGVSALLTDIFQKKVEQRNPYVRVVEVGENDTDPAKWGKNWPLQYDGYRRTALPTKTRYGGHGGSEALPEEKIERDRG